MFQGLCPAHELMNHSASSPLSCLAMLRDCILMIVGFFFLNVSSVLKSLNDFSSRRETSNSCFLIQQKLCFSSGQSWPLIYKMAPKKTERRWWVITRAAGWLVHSSFSWLSGNSSASILIWLNPFESIFEEEMPNLFWFQLLKKMNVFWFPWSSSSPALGNVTSFLHFSLRLNNNSVHRRCSSTNEPMIEIIVCCV